jgi:DNA-binding winged helix-turn-helix (wHTH) protein
MSFFRFSRTIDQTISVVRKHLGQDERIVTVFGIGYRHEFHWEASTSSREGSSAGALVVR